MQVTRILERHRTEAVQHRDSKPRWASPPSLGVDAVDRAFPFRETTRLHIGRVSRAGVRDTPAVTLLPPSRALPPSVE